MEYCSGICYLPALVDFATGKVFAEIEDSMARHGFAVVTMHLQDFATRDHGHVEELEMRLNRISKHGVKVVTISEINCHVVHGPEIYLQAQPRKETELAGG